MMVVHSLIRKGFGLGHNVDVLKAEDINAHIHTGTIVNPTKSRGGEKRKSEQTE